MSLILFEEEIICPSDFSIEEFLDRPAKDLSEALLQFMKLRHPSSRRIQDAVAIVFCQNVTSHARPEETLRDWLILGGSLIYTVLVKPEINITCPEQYNDLPRSELNFDSISTLTDSLRRYAERVDLRLTTTPQWHLVAACECVVVNCPYAVELRVEDDAVPDSGISLQYYLQRLNPQDSTCVICQEEMTGNLGDLARLRTCGHHFHATCIEEWLTRSDKTCPLCRELL